jgi:hypothetical protein
MLRHPRSDLPRDPAAVLRGLRRCRQDMIAISTNVRIGSPAFVAAHGITAAVDVMAEFLTGMRNYFWRGSSSSATDSELADHKRWAAIERGDEPWPSDMSSLSAISVDGRSCSRSSVARFS